MVKLFSGTPLSQFAQPTRPAGAAAAARATAPATSDAAPAVSAASAAPASRPARIPRVVEVPPPAPAVTRFVPIARLAAGGRWRVEAMRAYAEPLLLWFTRGQGRITVGGITRGYGAHNAVFIPAGMMHGFEPGVHSSGTALFFGPTDGLELPEDPLHLRIREVGQQAEISAIIENIQREIESDRPGRDRATRHHLGLLAVWLERHADTAADESPRPDAARRLARAYSDVLERDFRSGKGIADYARDLGVTATHLTRVCNRTCGRSASDLLHDRLIFEARKLLSETRMPVKAIAAGLGFTSPAYFTRAFQHRTGKTPSGFRKAP